MWVADDQLETLFRKINQIREELAAYAIGGDDPSASIDNLHRMIEQMYGIKIKLSKVPVSTRHFTSMVLRYEDRAEIILPAELHDYETRYAVAKELVHLALDQREDWSVDAARTIDGLIELGELEIRGIADHEPQRVVVCEHLAEVGAIELLYPRQSRDYNESQVASGKLTYAKIAVRFKLPVRAVRRAHQPSYKLMCSQFDTE